jgi:hypothetical protein
MQKKFYTSFHTTRFDILKAHWEKHSPKLENGAVGSKEPIVNVDLGGMVFEVDWLQKKVTHFPFIRCPGGIEIWRNHIVVPSMWEHEIYFFDRNFNMVNSFSHPYLSDIHSISLTSNDTLLVTSTGIDAILEFTFDGTLIWNWFATLNGYTIDQLGVSRNLIIENIDHRKNDYPTLSQTTHLNSVIEDPFSDDYLITTLFHQGEVVSVDKKTGSTTVLLSGLLSPHGLRKTENGFIVSNTRLGETLILDKNFKILSRFDLQSSWLQDSCISPWGTLFGIRSEKYDIIEVSLSNGEILDEFKYDSNWRGYQIFFPDSII